MSNRHQWQYQALAAPVLVLLPLLDWYQQQPDPVRVIARPAAQQAVAYESYCFTSIVNSANRRDFNFAPQTDAFVATWKSTPNAAGLDCLTVISEGLLTGFDASCKVRYNTSNNIDVRNGAAFAADQTIGYTAGVENSFRVSVNVALSLYTVEVDGATLAADFAFDSAFPTPTQLDHWSLICGGASGGTHEVCDFKVEAITPDKWAPQFPDSLARLPQPAPSGAPFVPVVERVPGPEEYQLQPAEPIQPQRIVDEGIFVVDADLLTQGETVLLDKWWQQYPDPLRVRGLTPSDLPFVPVVERVPGPEEYQLQPPDPVQPRPLLEGISVVDADLLTRGETVLLDKWFQQHPDPQFPARLTEGFSAFVRVEAVPGPEEWMPQAAVPVRAPEQIGEQAFTIDPFLLTQGETVLLDKWLPTFPDPLRVARVIDVQAVFLRVEPEVPLDRWYNQRPEQILVPRRPVDEGFFVIDPEILTQGETVNLDKWWKQYPDPIFLPVRVENLRPAVFAPPLGAVPVVGTTETTVSTFLAKYIGTPGTKYRVRVRQIEGTASLATVAMRSSIRAQFYPRTVLLAANQNLLPDFDTFLQGFFGFECNNTETDLFTELQDTPLFAFERRSHPCWEFDVSAFSGLIWKSAKLRLFRANTTTVDASVATITRVIRTWDLTQATFFVFDGVCVVPPGPGHWTTPGARGNDTDHDHTAEINWSSPKGAIDTQLITPDLTSLINEANASASGILRLIILYHSAVSAGTGFHRYHSLEAVNAAFHPVLMFEAF